MLAVGRDANAHFVVEPRIGVDGARQSVRDEQVAPIPARAQRDAPYGWAAIRERCDAARIDGVEHPIRRCACSFGKRGIELRDAAGIDPSWPGLHRELKALFHGRALQPPARR
jgi:hypothetical protein